MLQFTNRRFVFLYDTSDVQLVQAFLSNITLMKSFSPVIVFMRCYFKAPSTLSVPLGVGRSS